MRAQEPMTELLCLLLIFGVAGKMTMESVVPAEKASQKPQNFHQHLPHPLIYTTEIFSFLSTREMSL